MKNFLHVILVQWKRLRPAYSLVIQAYHGGLAMRALTVQDKNVLSPSSLNHAFSLIIIINSLKHLIGIRNRRLNFLLLFVLGSIQFSFFPRLRHRWMFSHFGIARVYVTNPFGIRLLDFRISLIIYRFDRISMRLRSSAISKKDASVGAKNNFLRPGDQVLHFLKPGFRVWRCKHS